MGTGIRAGFSEQDATDTIGDREQKNSGVRELQVSCAPTMCLRLGSSGISRCFGVAKPGWRNRVCLYEKL